MYNHCHPAAPASPTGYHCLATMRLCMCFYYYTRTPRTATYKTEDKCRVRSARPSGHSHPKERASHTLRVSSLPPQLTHSGDLADIIL